MQKIENRTAGYLEAKAWNQGDSSAHLTEWLKGESFNGKKISVHVNLSPCLYMMDLGGGGTIHCSLKARMVSKIC